MDILNTDILIYISMMSVRPRDRFAFLGQEAGLEGLSRREADTSPADLASQARRPGSAPPRRRKLFATARARSLNITRSACVRFRPATPQSQTQGRPRPSVGTVHSEDMASAEATTATSRELRPV